MQYATHMDPKKMNSNHNSEFLLLHICWHLASEEIHNQKKNLYS